jgi:exopolysaccharide biosynthesis polyprenyl glycosylphosphotransferase
MLHKSISRERLSGSTISFKTDTRDFLDIIELLVVLLCIPLSYVLSVQLIKHFDFPFYSMNYKLFLLRYLNYFNYSWQFNLSEFIFFSLLILISWYAFSRLTVMAKLPTRRMYLTTVIHFVRGYLFILLILLASKFIFYLTSIPVIFIFTYVSVSLPITLAIRLFSIYRFNIYRARTNNLRQVLVIADDNYIKILDKLLNQKYWGYRVYSIITDSGLIKNKYGSSVQVWPESKDLKSIIDNNVIDEVIYCKSHVDKKEIHNLVEICNEIGVVFRIQSSQSSVDPMQISLRTVNQKGMLTLVDIPSLKLPLEVKTMADFYLSLFALIFLFPVFLIIAFLIRLDSKGPVFFKQERVGLRGRKFKLYKFRTMVQDAEEMLDSLKVNNEMDGPAFKMKHDPRITGLGRFLRKTGIDEFPQLINVIKGEMSLIGPRPPLESEVKQYQRWHLRRLSVKPGITCTWQIMPERNDIKFEKWMNMDLNYIDNWSLGLDVRLFFKTITTLFIAGGR